MREICAKVSKFQQSHAQKKKATKRQSDTTIFAKSAESAKSAKPNFALNGVGDGSLWVAEYLTNI
jgi:hypothetical protein